MEDLFLTIAIFPSSRVREAGLVPVAPEHVDKIYKKSRTDYMATARRNTDMQLPNGIFAARSADGSRCRRVVKAAHVATPHQLCNGNVTGDRLGESSLASRRQAQVGQGPIR